MNRIASTPDTNAAVIPTSSGPSSTATPASPVASLRASKIAAQYYEHLGWQKIENGWFVPREAWEQ